MGLKEGKGRLCELCFQVFATEQDHYTVIRAVCGNLEEIRNQEEFCKHHGRLPGEGNSQTKPFGNFSKLVEYCGGTWRHSKETLIKYSNQRWLIYKLEDGEKWPRNGT